MSCRIFQGKDVYVYAKTRRGWGPCPDLSLGEGFPLAVGVHDILSQHKENPLGISLHPGDKKIYYSSCYHYWKYFSTAAFSYAGYS